MGPGGPSLAEETFLSDDFVRKLTAVGEVDILVGVPTFNNRTTIAHVVNAVQLGLVKYFPRERVVIINPDGGSTDGTSEIVRTSSIQDFRSMLSASPLRTIHRITTSTGKLMAEAVHGASSWRLRTSSGLRPVR